MSESMTENVLGLFFVNNLLKEAEKFFSSLFRMAGLGLIKIQSYCDKLGTFVIGATQ